MEAEQSTHGTTGQPALRLALAVLAALGAAAPAHGQQRAKAVRAAGFLSEPPPTGRQLGTVPANVEVIVVSTRGDWTEVSLEGWVWGASVERVDRQGHDLEVTNTGGENLRERPNGSVIARLREGFLLDEMSRENDWVRARRTGWMPSQALAALKDSADTSARPNAVAPDTVASLDRAVMARSAPLRRVPDGDTAGVLAAETPVKVLARSGEWVRVETQGWVRQSDLRPSSDVLVGVSGAEVRTRPQEFEGRLLQWTVTFISLGTADELRREIETGRRYILARGPLPEIGFMYLVGTDAHMAEFARMAPLTDVIVIGRIKAARSRYLGNPVVEIVDMRATQS